MTLRDARGDDAGWTHALRNTPHIRQVSIDQREIPYNGHVAWWTAALRDPDRRLRVIVLDGRDVGVVRLDRLGEGAEISIYMRADAAGQGVGRRAIAAGAELAREAFGARFVRAVIRDDNTASQRAFAAAGFVPTPDGWMLPL